MREEAVDDAAIAGGLFPLRAGRPASSILNAQHIHCRIIDMPTHCISQ